MSDLTNLLYNGDFSHGTDMWSGSGLTVSDGVATLTGNLFSQYKIPVANNRRYRISFDIKFNTVDTGKAFYSCLFPYDNDLVLIPNNQTFTRSGSGTTLASAINSGDTTATLTSSTGWSSGYIGICDKLAWGYGRATQNLPFSSISGTTVTLKSAYSGTSIPAGTKVINTYASYTYYYPWYLTNSDSNKPTEWTTVSEEFNGGNSIRYSCQYISFVTLGYTHNYSIRNIKIECISDYQECQKISSNGNPQFIKQGIVQAQNFDETGMRIRYIRDTTNGNSKNSNSHWCEVEVINGVGENIALGKDFSINGTNYSNRVSTDGVINSSYVGTNSGKQTLLLDLGFVELIKEIRIWHYYPDGRTYNDNVTEVSADNKNWIKIYEGKKPETADGNIIKLNPRVMSMTKDNEIFANEIIEW